MGILPYIMSTVLVLVAVQEQNNDETTADSTSTVKIGSDVILDENFPNPFWAKTIVSFTIAKDDSVKIELFNLLGDSVGVVLDAFLKAGSHSVTFGTDGLISGVYFYRLITPDTSITRKMMLLK